MQLIPKLFKFLRTRIKNPIAHNMFHQWPTCPDESNTTMIDVLNPAECRYHEHSIQFTVRIIILISAIFTLKQVHRGIQFDAFFI